MNRLMIRVIVAVVAVCIGGIVAMNRKGDASAHTLKFAHSLVAKVDGYSQKPDYYDWLVDRGHEEVFSSAYHDDSTRRHTDTWVDNDQYLDDLFDWMIRQANEDHATGVAEALTKYRDEHAHRAVPPSSRRGPHGR